MEYRLLARVVEELSGILPGARVDRVLPSGDGGVVIVLHQRKRKDLLLLAPERPFPRIHLLSKKPAAASSSAPFFLSVKKHLSGSTFAAVRLLNQDRVVELEFSRLDTGLFVVFELLGASSNLVLTDHDRRIISVQRPVPPGDRVMRPLIPGIRYEPPEKRPVRAAETDSVLLLPPEGPALPTLNSAVEAFFEKLTEERAQSSLRQRLQTAVRKARVRAERRCEAVQGDLASAEKGEDYRQMGELILANLPRLERGQEHADLQGSDGMVRRIMLDPSRSPAENAGRYFRRYKKAKAGLTVLRERLTETREGLELLSRLQRDLEAGDDRQTLDAVGRALTDLGLIRDRADRGVTTTPAPSPYRTVPYGGWEILIGRSAAGNDYVSLRLARPDDLWLHAEGMPGSHVLVRNPGKRDVPPDVLRRAASLAAFYSKGRGSAKVSVAYTPAKYVRKPKGAAAGTVLLVQRKSIMAVPEPAERRSGRAP